MAPVANTLALVLAAASTVSSVVEAKPLLSPGRHASPKIANIISSSKRSFHNLYHRYYYGIDHGLTKPGPLGPEKRDATIPAGWAYHGCISESWNERLLQGFAFSSGSLTPLLCLTECGKQGYSIAGMEFSDECYCGNTYVGTGGAPNSDSVCSMPCSGDSSSSCGNAWRLSLYTYNMSGLPTCQPDGGNTVAIPSAPATASVSASATGSLSASVSASASASLSASLSSSISASLSASLSSSLSASAVSASASSASSLSASLSASLTSVSSAAASPSPSAGGETTSEWYSLGCAVDSFDRLLTGFSQGQIMDLTIDKCLTMCEDRGFAFAGVEFGEECYCGNSIPTTVTYRDAQCDVPCKGNPSETCGGGFGLELFELLSSGDDCVSGSSSLPSLTTAGYLVTPASSSSVAVTGTTSSAKGAVSVPASSVITVAPTVRPTTAPSSSAVVIPSSSVVVSSVPPATSTIPASSDEHYVWAHHMVGNTYPYGSSDWNTDIVAAHAAGIDGFALNMGSDWWQPARIADAYDAAAASGSGFKMFLSLDMTVMACNSQSDASNLVNLVSRWATHSAQALHNGKVLVSTFAGSDCSFGTGSAHGWQTSFVDVLKARGINIFFVPSVFSDISTFKSNSWMDGELNWNSAWPMGKSEISTDTDKQYMNALGSKEYMAAISPFFYTHFGANSWNKNWLYRGDNWLYCTRWEQLIAMRQQVKSLEILTWNDYGESSYIGPIHGAMPAGSEAWTNGYDHTALNVLTKYYATAYKTGQYPAITKDQVILWSRPHTHDARASNDGAGQPTGWDWTDDNLYAVVLTTGPASVTLTSGSNSQTFSVEGGLTKLRIPSAVGGISGTISRNGATVAQYAPAGFSYTTTPQTYNFNYFLGASS